MVFCFFILFYTFLLLNYEHILLSLVQENILFNEQIVLRVIVHDL